MGTVIRSGSWCVVAGLLALSIVNPALAQNRVQFVAKSKTKATQTAAARPASQIVDGEPVEAPEANYESGGNAPGGPGYGLSPGFAYGPLGPFGYRPDFGFINGNMSAWPGVPACCDPWFGYCGEPRCYPCACGQGRHMYFHCPHGGCGPELLVWQKGDLSCCKPAGMCYGAQGCSSCGQNQGCAKCRSASYSPAVDGSGAPTVMEQAPNAKPLPGAGSAPPRNDLPTQPSARRRASPSTT